MHLKKSNQMRLLKEKGLLFRFDSFRALSDGSYIIPEHLKALEGQIAEQRIVEIEYTGGSFKEKYRPVRPISILPMPKGAYLYSQCLLTGTHKSFAIKKIKSVRIINDEEVKHWEDHLDKIKTSSLTKQGTYL